MNCKCTICYYCDDDVSEQHHEHDHFPLPRRHGGKQTVAACRRCHHLKDRTPLVMWPPEISWRAFESIWAKCSPLERLVLAKYFSIALDAVAAEERARDAKPPW